MVTLVNRAKMSTSTTGTGTITLGSAETGYQTFADAGVADGDVVRYVIEDGNDWEIGSGTYTATGTTLSRTVDESSNSDAALNLTGSAVVFITAAAGDVFQGELFAENPSSPTAPSATGTNAVAIGSGASATGFSSFSFGQGASSTADQAFSFGLNAQATAVRSLSFFGEAGSTQSTAIGYNSAVQKATTATGSGAMALGGSRASGTDSFAAAIASNSSSYGATATGSIAVGTIAKATGNYSVALGISNVANAQYGCAIGRSNTAGNYGTAIGGGSNACYGANSAVFGGESGYVASNKSYSLVLNGWDSHVNESYSVAIGTEAQSDIIGKLVYASGKFAARGDAQGGQFILRADTTDATATVLTTNNSTAAATNQIVAASDTCIMFSGTIVAMQNGAQDQGGWEIKGLLKNDGGTTTLVSSNIQTFSDGNSWTVALSADNTNNALAITCTGEAAHNIRWVANISTSEVTYA